MTVLPLAAVRRFYGLDFLTSRMQTLSAAIARISTVTVHDVSPADIQQHFGSLFQIVKCVEALLMTRHAMSQCRHESAASTRPVSVGKVLAISSSMIFHSILTGRP